MYVNCSLFPSQIQAAKTEARRMIEKSSVTEEIPVAFDEEGSTDNEVIQVAEEVPVTAVAESQSA